MIRVMTEPFDAGAELAAFSARLPQAGAIVTFLGQVRGNDGAAGEVSAMTIEHYPGMTEKEMEAIEAEARRRWSLFDLLVIHRYGRLMPGDPIVLVMTASRHRHAAYEANEFLIDWLKTKAPFWKKEEGPEGARWVEAKTTDDTAAARWQ
jgi:molybdopterin synthase catalytic subunit